MEAVIQKWNFSLIWKVYILALLASYLFLPCLCHLGIAKLKATAIIFALIGFRIFLAWKRKEVNNDWKIYIGLMIISPITIELYYNC